MNLDKRIKKNKTYLDCFDIKMAKRFIGKECYIADVISAFRNLNNLTKATLTDVAEYGNDAQPYTLNTMRSTYSAGLILPCEWVEEPKYRPYTLTEFLREYGVGDEIVVKRKDYTTACSHKLFVEYSTDIDKVLLGGFWYSFQDLCDTYIVRTKDGEWKPFGIKE